MDSYLISGGKILKGEVDIKGAKNAVLPILAACIATGKETVLHNCPDLSDVRSMIVILEELGCKINRISDTIIIDSKDIHNTKISAKLMREMRSSVFLMGPMIARFGQVTMSYPGGCEIGLRPIDIHISALKKLGVKVNEENGVIHCKGEKLIGNEIILSFPSVGATENAMLTAIGAKGETIIKNAAREPEIVDLQNFLNSCGAEIKGAGTGRIIINGNEDLRQKGLNETEYTVMADRIEAGTFLAAVAITKGEVYLNKINPEYMNMILAKIVETGCKIVTGNDFIWVKAPEILKPVAHINTEPHPGFPTDMQSQMLSLLTIANGDSVITETIFESRFKNVDQLLKMGAKVRMEGRNAIISGVDRIVGTRVVARDLRGGAALVIAGLGAEGETVVENICHIDRGYDKFEVALRNLGADIQRV